MNPSAAVFLRALPLLLVPVIVLVAPEEARAADAVVAYEASSHDPSGLSAHVGPGLSGCAAGCATLRVPARRAVGARRQAQLQFAAPAGTTIVQASVRMRLRTRQPGVVARIQSRVGGRWLSGARLRSVTPVTRTVVAGRGATAIAVQLATESAISARAVRADAENAVTVESVQMTVRDVRPPQLAWDSGAGTRLGWQRGILCATGSATDIGLGVDRLEYAIGPATEVAHAPAGPRLQPRPSQWAAEVCIDTADLEDGAYGTALSAVDSGDSGNRTSLPGGLVRVDNTPPTAELIAPADREARLPELRLRVSDGASGVAALSASVDGFPVVVTTSDGIARFVPPQPLVDGLHRVSWEVDDAAGNRTVGSEVLEISDSTPPVIDAIAPEGVAHADAVVTARVADSGAGIAADGIRIAVDGGDVTALAEIVDGVVRVHAPVAWAPGEHTVQLAAVDRSGNRAVRTWTFAVPVPPPPPEPTPINDPGPGPDGALESASMAAPGRLALVVPAIVSVRGRAGRLRIAVTRDGEPAVGVRVRVTRADGTPVGRPVVDVEGIAELELRGDRGLLLVQAEDQRSVVRIVTEVALRLRTSQRAVRAGGSVTLSGNGARRAVPVLIEARVGSRWLAVVRVRVDAGGRFSSPVRLAGRGAYSVRARQGDSVSGVLRLRAR